MFEVISKRKEKGTMSMNRDDQEKLVKKMGHQEGNYSEESR